MGEREQRSEPRANGGRRASVVGGIDRACDHERDLASTSQRRTTPDRRGRHPRMSTDRVRNLHRTDRRRSTPRIAKNGWGKEQCEVPFAPLGRHPVDVLTEAPDARPSLRVLILRPGNRSRDVCIRHGGPS